MKILKIIYDNIPRIAIAVLAIWTFFNLGLFFAVVAALIPVFSRYMFNEDRKPIRKTTAEFIREIDESGDHHE